MSPDRSAHKSIIWLLAGSVLCIFVFFCIPAFVQSALSRRLPELIQNFIEKLYPRLIVEKHRFNSGFFIQKAQQIVFRTWLILFLSAFSGLFYTKNKLFSIQVKSFWNEPVSRNNHNLILFIFFSGLLFYTTTYWFDLPDLYRFSAFYQPVSFLRWLSVPFPAPFISRSLCIFLYVSCLCIILKQLPVFFASLAAILFILFQGWMNSFEKMEHTYTTLTYAALLMPFLANQENKPEGWALPLIRLSVGTSYFFAGIEKLSISGLDWFRADTLIFHLQQHPTDSGLWASHYPFLCTILQISVIFFEIGFVACVFFPSLRWIFLPMGVAFHTGTWVLMNIGHWSSPWVFVYLFFIRWDKVLEKTRIFFRRYF
jgi:uncharacterized membrane protein YphA (DoxX/SURF4 family)